VVKPRLLRPLGFQLSSSSSEEHEYYSGAEVDFGDEPALPDTSKFSHISEGEMQVYVPGMVPPTGEIATTEDISSILLNCFSIRLGKCFNVSFLYRGPSEANLQLLLTLLR